MLSRRSLTPFIPAFLLLSHLALPGTAAWAQQALGDPFSDSETYLGEDPGRYAMVRTVEGAVTLFKDGSAETLERGLPIAEGDVVESHGRGVLQLGDGTLVAFGPGTRLRIQVLDAEGRDGRIVLALERGRLRIRRPVRSDASLRVETPAGAASLEEGGRGDLSLETDEGGRTLFRIHGGRGVFANGQGTARLFAGERLTVYGPGDGLDRVADFNSYALDGFDAWAGDLLAVRPGEAALHVPASLRWYAGDLDNAGSWVYVDEEATWCWRPRGVDAEWRPYLRGRWGAFRGGLTWISHEPWGYVTHHHGRWGWSGAFGWYWIPGAAYSPAWVAWGGDGARLGWAPLGRHNRPSVWTGGAPCWHVVDVRHAGAHDLFRHLRAERRGFEDRSWGSRPWHGGRLLMARGEWNDPDRLRQVLARPEILRQRETAWHGSAPGRFRHPEPPRVDPPRVDPP
ncbi:MAG TPA: DUF6600 domain-containing protein, partial [Holophaga sp.]|nr:DUF6600 domain-containing protein [Holophaga sp.]